MKDQKKAGVLISYLTIGMNILVQLFYTPMMLQLLGQEEYGVYTLSSGIISYLSLFDLGLSSTYLKFYFKYKKENDSEKIAILNGTFFKVFFILSFLVTISGISLAVNISNFFEHSLTANEVGRARIVMLILTASMALTLMSNVWTAIIIANEKFVSQKGLGLFKIIFSPFIAVPLMLKGYGAVSTAIASLAVSILSLTYSFLYCKRRIGCEMNLRGNHKGLLFEMFGFSFFIFLNDIISQINWNIDKVLLGYFRGTVETAIYGLGSQIDTIYRSLSTSISSVFVPTVNRIINEEERSAKISELFVKVGRLQYMIIFPILEGFLFYGQKFIELWAGKEYAGSYMVALLLMLPATVPLIQNIGIDIQRAKNKHKFRSIIYSVMAVINIVISIPLCIRWGAAGSAAGTFFSLALGNGLIMNVYYAKHLSLDIKSFWLEIWRLTKAMILPTLTAILSVKFIKTASVSAFIVGLAAFILSYLFSIIVFGLNKNEKMYLKDVIRKIIGR